MTSKDNYLKTELYALVREDESIFEFLQDGSLDGMWYWDLENPESEWMSPRFWTLLGYDPAEKSHQSSEWQDLIHPEDLKIAIENFKKHCDDPNHPYDQVVRYTHKNGSTVWVRCRGLAIRDDNGKPVRMLGAHTDLTSQKQAQQHLAQSEAFLATVFDSIQDGICVLDRDMNIVKVNRTMEKWYASEAPLAGKKCFEAYHGRTEICEVCPTVRAMKSGELEKDEITLESTGGENRTMELFSFPMFDDQGQVLSVVEYVRDITKRKHARSLLMEREQLYRALFENNKSVMLLVDPQTGGIIDANPAACTYYGYTKEILAKMNVSDVNTLSKQVLLLEMERAKSERRNYFNFQHRLADGTIRDVEVFSGPITVSGRELLCSIIHDVSDRRLAEKQRDQLIGDLKKTLSEVKTLRGFLPICASCKKIRDDQGYWNQIETYIHEHSEAEFSHSICPECVAELYPDFEL